MQRWRSPRVQYLVALGMSSLVSLGLFAYGAWRSHEVVFTYLVWNLFLAWLPLVFALRLMRTLGQKLWSSWEALALSFLWIIFLPNSFYLISDFIHLQDVSRADLLYTAVIFTSFVATGLALGFSSLYLIHHQLRRRLSGRAAGAWIGAVLLACSMAVYMGRDLRWNTWDVVVNPAGVLFDISDSLRHPEAYPQMLLAVTSFFVLLASIYNMIWHGTRIFLPHRSAAVHQSDKRTIIT